MGEIVEFPQQHIVVPTGTHVSVFAVEDVRAIASGARSIAEYQNPEILAQALAVLVLEYLND